MLREIVACELGGLIGVSGNPLLFRIGRHARAMPQYIIGHLDRVEAIRRHKMRFQNLADAFGGTAGSSAVRGTSCDMGRSMDVREAL